MSLTNYGILCIQVSHAMSSRFASAMVILIVVDTFQVIPLEQAARLPNNSSIIPGDPERRYAVELSVLHDLHCLVSNT